jgi:hypothetical protein
MMNLRRDHNHPCGHEREETEWGLVGAFRIEGGGWVCGTVGCPGGREINTDINLEELRYWWDAALDPDASNENEDRISKRYDELAEEAVIALLEIFDE